MPYREKRVEKLYYTIGECATELNVPVSTVRYWESEFPQLKPTRNKKGNRLFTAADLAKLKKIHYFLRERGMTIEGARKALSADSGDSDRDVAIAERLKSIRSMLVEIIESL